MPDATPTEPIKPAGPNGPTRIAVVGAPDGGARRAWSDAAPAWPGYVPAPPVDHLTLAEALADDASLAGCVALFDARDPEARSGVGALAGALAEAGAPGVALVEPGVTVPAPVAGMGVIPVPHDVEPGALATTLAALAQRQASVEPMRRELIVARRFQGGLAGEMDKLHEELQLAATVQREMLPKRLPEAEGYEFRVLYRSAGYVSGDTYNVRRLDDRRIGFFVADAVGHGVPAALMTMIIIRGMQMMGDDAGRPFVRCPSESLRALNQELIRHHSEAPRFATAVAGVLDTTDGSLTIAGAGHPPALIIGADGEAEPIETEGPLLGVFADNEFAPVRRRLGANEMLVLYSDGFETAFPDARAPAYQRRLPTHGYLRRFGDLARDWQAGGLDGAMAGFTAALDCQQGSLHQLDDLTAVVIAPKRAAGEGAGPSPVRAAG